MDISRCRIAGLDWGSKRWGWAVLDQEFEMIFPRKIIDGKDQLGQFLGELEKEEIKHVVIGYPLNMDGSISESCKKIDKIKAQLEVRGYVVDLIDERLTSEEAHRELSSYGLNARKKKEILDSQAAVIILREYLASK